MNQHRTPRTLSAADYEDLLHKINAYEKALFVIGELAVVNWENTIVWIVDRLNVPKMERDEFEQYLRELKEQKKGK